MLHIAKATMYIKLDETLKTRVLIVQWLWNRRGRYGGLFSF